MMTMRRWAVGTAVVFGLSALAMTTLAKAQVQSQPQEPVAGLMLAKMAASQTIVAGLVSKDFDQIRRGAIDMIRICDASEWEGNQDSTYSHHRQELRRQAMKLTILADDQNLDGAAFVYMNSVSTCISCHQHCRDVLRIAQRPSGGVIRIPTAVDESTWSSPESSRR